MGKQHMWYPKKYREVHEKSEGTCGSHGIERALRKQGRGHSRKRIARLMAFVAQARGSSLVRGRLSRPNTRTRIRNTSSPTLRLRRPTGCGLAISRTCQPIKRSRASPHGYRLQDRIAEGCAPHELGLFVRSEAEIARAEDATRAAEIPYHILDNTVATTTDQLSIGTMHLAKGLEFRAIAVMACDDEIIPLHSRMESVADESDLEEVFETERHLLYVACTRARDRLVVTGVGVGSEFLGDMGGIVA